MNDYETQVLGPTPTPNNAEWLSVQVEQLDRQLHKMKKKKKRKKGKGRKKLKKRIRALEQEYQQLRFILFAMCQGQKQTAKLQQPWWQEVVVTSLPKALDLATVSVSRLPPKRQTPLALPEARDCN